MEEPLEWNEAQHKAKLIQEQKKTKALQHKKEQEENMELAVDRMWDALESEHFSYGRFQEICEDYGLDEEDLIDRLI
jgi:hypothetical protein